MRYFIYIDWIIYLWNVYKGLPGIFYACFGLLHQRAFLGGLGCLALSVTENIAAAYMVPLLVYGINMAGGKRLGSLYLFSLTLGEWGSKTFMLIAALIFCGAAFLVQKRRRASV